MRRQPSGSVICTRQQRCRPLGDVGVATPTSDGALLLMNVCSAAGRWFTDGPLLDHHDDAGASTRPTSLIDE